MKIFKIVALIILIGLVLFFAAGFYFIKTFDANDYRAQITESMSESLNRKVSIEHIDLTFSLKNGIRMLLKEVAIADDPAFSNAEIISVKSIYLGVDVMTLVTTRELIISEISVETPKVHIVKSQDQKINIVDFSKEMQTSEKEENQDYRQTTESKSNSFVKLNATVIKAIHINNGIFQYTDASMQDTKEFSIEKIDININGFRLDQEFSFVLNCALFSDSQNVEIDGVSAIDLVQNTITIRNLELKTNASTYRLKDLYAFMPQLKEMGIQRRVEGDIVVALDQLIAGPKGVQDLRGQGTLSDGAVSLNVLSHPLDNVDAVVHFNGQEANLKSLRFHLASGIVTGKGNVQNIFQQKDFTFALLAQGLSLKELLAKQEMPAEVVGKLNGEINLVGKLGAQDMFDTFQGPMTFEVLEGKVLDINIMKVVLDKISFIPNLSQKIYDKLSQENRQRLSKTDTDIKQASVSTEVRGREVLINDAVIDADGFIVQAKGKVSLAQQLSLRSVFSIPKVVAVDMVGAVEELRALQAPQGHIVIPMQDYNGPLKNFRTLPDVGQVAAEVLKERGKMELQKLLRKAGGMEGSTEQENTPADAGQTQEPKSSPEEVLINDVLDVFFGN